MFLALKSAVKKIQNRSMKNLLTQWDIEMENQKMYEMWLVKNLLTYK